MSTVTRSNSTPESQPVAGSKSAVSLNRQLFCHNMNHYGTQREQKKITGVEETVIIVILMEKLFRE